MALIFWDASALIKRYFVEVGSDAVDAAFAHAHVTGTLATTAWGYAETYAALLRKLNSRILDPASFTAAVTSLQAEVVDSADFGLLPISDPVIFAGISVMRKHNLNAADAAILTTLLTYAQSPGAPACVLIASDKRLIRAAEAEGLNALNPELAPAADVPAFLAAL